MLELEITKCYPGFTLQTALSANREAILLGGPSGSGKTTLLRCIAGLEQPDHGFIYYRDTAFFKEGQLCRPPACRKAVLMSQDCSLFPHLTVRQNILYAHKRHAPAPQLYNAIIEQLDLKPLEHSNPSLLSGGEARRVMLGRSLIANPEIMLLDEPFAGQDQFRCRRISALLAEYQRTYRPVMIIATHTHQELFDWINRKINLKPGRVAVCF